MNDSVFFAGKDVGSVTLALWIGPAAEIESMVKRHETALQIQIAAHEKLKKLRAGQGETDKGEDGDQEETRLECILPASHGPVKDTSQNSRAKEAISGMQSSHLDIDTRPFGRSHCAATANEAAEARLLQGFERAVPRPLALKYRVRPQNDAILASEKFTHTISLTIVGIARLPPISTELDGSDGCGGDTGVRDSSDMMTYRPCGIYVRSQVPGDADEILTPVVPVSSYLALHAQSSRSFVLPKEHDLLDSVPALVETPAWTFEVMHRHKAATGAGAERQIGYACLSREDIVELLSGDCHPGAAVTSALSLPVNITASARAQTVDASAQDCTLRVRLAYEKTPYFGSDHPAKSLLASVHAESGLQGEFECSNSLQLSNFRISGLKAGADKLARDHSRCRLVPFDGPNAFVVLHFWPTPPWLQQGEGRGGNVTSHKRFHTSETVVHSFCPAFNFTRMIPVTLTEKTMEYLNSAVLVVEAWHRVPRDGLEDYTTSHDSSMDPRIAEGAVHSRDLLMACASIPLQVLLVRPDGISGWHILHTSDGVAAGAVELTCRLGDPVSVHLPDIWSANDRCKSPTSSSIKRQRQIEVQLLLEEVWIDGMDEIDCAFMGAAPAAGRRQVEIEYSFCGLAEPRSCSRLMRHLNYGVNDVARSGCARDDGGDIRSRRVAFDHCSSVTADLTLENLQKLVSNHVSLNCSVLDGDTACSLGVLEIDISSLLNRAQGDMHGEVQWTGGTFHLVQAQASRLLARLRLKVALRLRECFLPAAPMHAPDAHAIIADSLQLGKRHCDSAQLVDTPHVEEQINIDKNSASLCTVRIERACDLAVDENGREPDTFIACTVDGDTTGRECTIKTGIVRQSCNPRWQHSQEVKLELDLLHGHTSRVLIFKVFRVIGEMDPLVANEEHASSALATNGNLLSTACTTIIETALGHADMKRVCNEEQKGHGKGVEERFELVGCAQVDLFQIQRSGVPIDGWYHVLDDR